MFKGKMLTRHAKLFALMLSHYCTREAAVVLGIRSTTHEPRLMTERVSHGDCLAVLHPRTLFKTRGGRVWHERKAVAGVALCIALALDMHEQK